MTEPLNLPESCTRALEAILADPLEPGASVENHVRGCLTCREARVAFLAQEEIVPVLSPMGYFERLPDRILGKLPTPPQRTYHRHLYWGAAAALLLAVGGTTFWAGRANRVPLVEASLPRTATEIQEVLPLADTPFQDNDDAVAQLTALSQEDADAVLRALSHDPAPTPAKK
jgi:hypothetical protein